MRCTCLLGTTQLLKLWNRLGYCHPNFLFHNDFHKTESIMQSEVFHVEAKPQRWGKTGLTQHPEDGGCQHWFRISVISRLSRWFSWPFPLVCNVAATSPNIKWMKQEERRKRWHQPRLIPFNKEPKATSEISSQPRRCSLADLMGQKVCRMPIVGCKESWESQHLAGYKVLQVRA